MPTFLTDADVSAFLGEPKYDVVAATIMTTDNHTLCVGNVSIEQLAKFRVKAATGTPGMGQPFAIWDPNTGKARDAIMGGINAPFPSVHPIAAVLKRDHIYFISPISG